MHAPWKGIGTAGKVAFTQLAIGDRALVVLLFMPSASVDLVPRGSRSHT